MTDKKPKEHKILKRVLIAIGVAMLILIVAGVGAFLYFRSMFSGPTVEIGEATDDAVVQTDAGPIRGYVTDGIYTYHGSPYAEAKERFMPAEPVEPWTEVRDMTEYGNMSYQAAIQGGAALGNDNGDNNCQNLNLWTPGLGDGGKRPILVWLHGGGFSSGSANDAQYDGTELSKYGDVVVVGVNHRLNVYGHLDLSAYDEKYQYSANVGVMDIVMALQWLQRNAEAFGGDPDNITVFGQSGGGAKVLSLMTSPYAKGTFSKGIVQSGATETLGVEFTSQEASTALTKHLLENLGISENEIDKLQTVSNQDLQRAATAALQTTADEFQIPAQLGSGYTMEWEPVVDGDYIPSAPVLDSGFADAGFDVPLLIGSNLNEWSFMGGSGQVTEEVKSAYMEAYPNEDPDGAGSVDTLLRLPLLKIMSHKADQGGAPVYAYLFTVQTPPMGAFHGSEIPFIFRHGNDNGINDLMSSIWVSFARDGVPAAEGLETWEPYDREGKATMILDHDSYLARGHDEKLLELLAPGYEY